MGHGVPSYPDGAHVFLSTIDEVGRSGQDSFPSGRRGLTRRPLRPYEGVGRSRPQLPGATPGGRLLTGDLLDFLEGCDRRPSGPTREGRARQSSLAGVRRGGALSQVSSVVGPLLRGSGVKRDGVLLEEVGRFLHAGLPGPFGRYPRRDCFVPSYVISWFSYSGKPNLGYLLPSSPIVAPDPPRGCLEPRGGESHFRNGRITVERKLSVLCHACGCARAHPLGLAPEPLNESEIRSEGSADNFDFLT